MKEPKVGQSQSGLVMHYSVGAVIKRDEKYFLIERANPPYGFAGPAGHIDKGENELEALPRELLEEIGLKLVSCTLLFDEELDWNECKRGVSSHHWFVFDCEVSGEVKLNQKEARSGGWYPAWEIKNLTLEPAWEYWFRKMGII